MIADILIFEEKYLKLQKDENFDELNKNRDLVYGFLSLKSNESIMLDAVEALIYETDRWRSENNSYFDYFETKINRLSIDFDLFKIIKNPRQLFLTYCALFILLSLGGVVRVAENEERAKTTHLPQTSDDVLNKVTNYLTQFILWFHIRYGLEIAAPQCFSRSFLFKLLTILEQNKIIYTKKIKHIKNKTPKIYFSNVSPIKPNLEFHGIKFQYIKINGHAYIYTNHFRTVQQVFKENVYSREIFKLAETEILDTLTDVWVYFDYDFFATIYFEFLKKHQLEQNTLFLDYEICIENLKNLIDEKDGAAVSKLSKRVSILETALRFKKIMELGKEFFKNKKIYLPFMWDFRGRIYYTSSFSPTFYSELRYCFHKGSFDPYDENVVKKTPLSMRIDELVEPYFPYINNIKISALKKQPRFLKIAVLWICVSIGEIYKTQLGKEVKLETFILKGVDIINNGPGDLDYATSIKCKYLIKILEEIGDGVYVRRLLSKDATASVYQHLIKCLGRSDAWALKLCNLNSHDTWYDTYQHIIDAFKKDQVLKHLTIELFNILFARKPLKRVIMTENYAAGEDTCWRYFFLEIQKVYEELTELQQKEVRLLFKKFYQFLHTNSLILKRRTKELLEFFKFTKNRAVLFNDGGLVNFCYYKPVTKEIDFVLNGTRYTKKYQVLTKESNEKKFTLSIRANYVQSLDACLVRWVLKKEPIISVHDCFLIDYINVSYLIALVNEGMRETFHDVWNEKITEEIFSIFIVL